MVVARFVVCIGLIAAVGCASNHSGDAPERAADGINGSNAADGATANSCVVTTVGPRIFPEDGACDDSDPVRGEFTLTPSGHYTVTCNPQPLDAPGCKGVPNDVWNSCALRRCEASVSYPKGCFVMMPTGNPHQGNYADTCECTDLFAKGELQWTCAG